MRINPKCMYMMSGVPNGKLNIFFYIYNYMHWPSHMREGFRSHDLIHLIPAII